MDARLPTVTEITEQLAELETKVLATLDDVRGPVVDTVAKAADAVAARLPEDRPGAVALVVGRVDFAKKLLDAQVAFTKAVLDAAVAPVAPKAPKSAKATKGAKVA